MATWATRRKWMIEGGFVALGVVILASVLIATLYKAPSCTDGKLNQGEEQVDCDGPCPYMCAADETEPVVRFATAVSPTAGRTDVIAYVDNPNAVGGVQHAAYTVELRGVNGDVLAQRSGTVNLPPSMTAPIFIPNMYQGDQIVAHAYLTIDPNSLKWLKAYKKPIVALPNNVQTINGSSAQPKVMATLSNPTAHVLYGVTVAATVFDDAGNAIAASQTVVSALPSQGSAPIVFTWNQPFVTTPARVEILPATGT